MFIWAIWKSLIRFYWLPSYLNMNWIYYLIPHYLEENAKTFSILFVYTSNKKLTLSLLKQLYKYLHNTVYSATNLRITKSRLGPSSPPHKRCHLKWTEFAYLGELPGLNPLNESQYKTLGFVIHYWNNNFQKSILIYIIKTHFYIFICMVLIRNRLVLNLCSANQYSGT